ncbi:MAG: hypothetical protein MUE44_12115 [Oscillatoriaceae cyanobacterium Prado104]|nr:hypothetical protein [Oscillatoriaceae cyanobacterium Prado104]
MSIDITIYGGSFATASVLSARRKSCKLDRVRSTGYSLSASFRLDRDNLAQKSRPDK